jgi:hypothetical protein
LRGNIRRRNISRVWMIMIYVWRHRLSYVARIVAVRKILRRKRLRK